MPYDGPHTPEKVDAAMLAVSGLVRYLNNATGPERTTLPYAASAHRVLSGLSGAVHGLPQLLEQLRAFLERQASDPTLYDERRDRPGSETAAELAGQLAAINQTTRPICGAVAGIAAAGDRRAGGAVVGRCCGVDRRVA